MGATDLASFWQISHQLPLPMVKGDNRGDPALIERFYGLDSWLVLCRLRIEDWQKRSIDFDPLPANAVTLCSH